MQAIIVLSASVLGGLWRRWHGMGQGPRIVRLLVAFILATAPWVLTSGFDFWPAYIVAAAITAYWIPGHDWTSLKKLLLRYGPPVAFVYWWAHRAHTKDPQAFKWGGFVDGPLALAEMFAGAFVFGLNALVACLI